MTEQSTANISLDGDDQALCSAGRNSEPAVPPSGDRRSSRSWFVHIVDQVFGYDFFVSYSWEDGQAYADALAAALQERGFECFLDNQSYASGDHWKEVGAWCLRRTGQLVLVATPAALLSPSVGYEVEVFASTKRRVIPIEFGCSLETLPASARLRRHLPKEVIRIREPCAAAEPSLETINKLVAGFSLVRQSQKRVRVFGVAALLLLALATTAIILGYRANQTAVELEKQRSVLQARLLSQNAERLLLEPRRDLASSTLLAIESYRARPNSDALALLRTNLETLADHVESVSPPWRYRYMQRRLLNADGTALLLHSSAGGREVLGVVATSDGRLKSRLTVKGAILAASFGTTSRVALAVRHEKADSLAVYDVSSMAAAVVHERPAAWGTGARSRSPLALSLSGELVAAVEKGRASDAPNIVTIARVAPYQVITAAEVSNEIRYVRFIDETRIITVEHLGPGRGERVRVVQFDSGVELGAKDLGGAVDALDVAADGRRIAVATGSQVHWLDLRSPALVGAGSTKLHQRVRQLRFSPEGRRLAVSSSEHAIVIDVGRGHPLLHIDEPAAIDGIGWVAQPDGPEILTVRAGSQPLEINRWRLPRPVGRTQTLAGTLYDPFMSTVFPAAFTRDGRTALVSTSSAEGQRSIGLYDVTGTEIKLNWASPMPGYAAALDPTGQFVAIDRSGGLVDVVRASRRQSGVPVRYATNEHELLTFLSFDSRGTTLVSSTHEWFPGTTKTRPDTSRVWNVPGGTLRSAFDTGVAVAYALSSDGHRLASATNFGVEVWDTASGARRYRIESSLKDVVGGEHFFRLSFSPDGALLAHNTVRGDHLGRVLLRRAETGDIVSAYPVSDEVEALVFDPTGRWLAIASSDGNIQLVDMRSLEVAHVLRRTSAFGSIAFDSSGRTAAVVERSSIGIWDLGARAAERDRIMTPLGGFVSFVEGSASLFGVGAQRVVVEDLSAQRIIRAALRRLRANLSLSDWLRYFPGEPYRRTVAEAPIGSIDGNLSLDEANLLLRDIDLAVESEFAARLVYWAVRKGRADLVPLLAEKHAALDIVESGAEPGGSSPVAEAARVGDFAVFQALARAGADWRHVANGRSSPLSIALGNPDDDEKRKIVEWLIARGAHADFLADPEPGLQHEREYLRTLLRSANRDTPTSVPVGSPF